MRPFPTCVVAVCSSLLVLAASAGDVENNIQKSFTVNEGGKLTMDVLGSIEVSTGSSSSVEVNVLRKVSGKSAAEAEKLFAKHEVRFSQTGNEITVKSEIKDQSRFWSGNWRLQIKYQVSVPKHFNLELRTSGGSVRIPDITGEVQMHTAGGSLKTGMVDGPLLGRTSGGSIEVGGCTRKLDLRTAGGSISIEDAQSVRAETSGGSIKVVRAKEEVYASTAGGSIRVEDAAGAVTAKTSGGSIHIGKVGGKLLARTAGGGIDIAEAAGAVDASTSAGSIRACLTGVLSEDSSLSTSGGAVRVTVPEGLNAELDAEASGGKISTDVPVTIRGEKHTGALKGRMGSGGKTLRVRTSAGSIEIRKLASTTQAERN